MEYKGYTPDKIKKDKKTNRNIIVLLVLPLVLGAFLIVGGISNILSIKIEEISDVPVASINSDTEYYFEEMVVVDSYAYVGNSVTSYVKSTDYLIRFVDGNGKIVYTTLRTEDYTKFNDALEEYIENENKKIGDLVLTGCFHGYSNGSKVSEYAKEAYELYYKEMPGEFLDWTFYYSDVDTIEEFKKEEISNESFFLILGSLFLVPSLVGVFVLVRKRKLLDQYLADWNEETYTEN